MHLSSAIGVLTYASFVLAAVGSRYLLARQFIDGVIEPVDDTVGDLTSDYCDALDGSSDDMLENENCICTNPNSEALEACGNCVINTERVPNIRVVRAYNAVKSFLKDCENSGNNVADINLVALGAGVSLSADSVESSASSLVVLLDPMTLLSLAILYPLCAAIAASHV
ncbi:hypothetical protein HYPSUDRAFT_206783 [Hypholoma sublateritium FD-334 SS-4]|uniref:Uncharacterized protein n=1 Tax=Hypholoma sublateritium (strain FD-334 SS-4) TaxID=945553 RepID=A0A0D2M0P8_HYPSF|nr:hypothetical protein HYPSUDRAFT_206783 [Hypholoma sublateritium FD-334 SS-4]